MPDRANYRWLLPRLTLLASVLALGCKEPEATKVIATVPFRVEDERFGSRLEAAWKITEPTEKEKAIQAIAEDAAVAGNAEATKKALEGLSDATREAAVHKCAAMAAGAGEPALTLELMKMAAAGTARDQLAMNVVNLLIAANEGRAALEVAGFIESAALRNQALIRLTDRANEGLSPLAKAAKQGKLDALKAALERGGDVQEKDRDGNTALWYAARKGHAGMVRLLLEKGAHPDTKNNMGTTALMAAAESGHLDCVHVLLAKSADPTALNNDGKTAELLADAAGKKDIAELLRKRTKQ